MWDAGSGRTLAQVISTTPLRVNATFIGISAVSNEDALAIKSTLNASITTPKPLEVVVSSNPAAKAEVDRVTLVILVYPKSTADTAQLQSHLEARNQSVTWLQLLNAAGMDRLDNIQVNSVALQSSVNPGGKPVTGASLLGGQQLDAPCRPPFQLLVKAVLLCGATLLTASLACRGVGSHHRWCDIDCGGSIVWRA